MPIKKIKSKAPRQKKDVSAIIIRCRKGYLKTVRKAITIAIPNATISLLMEPFFIFTSCSKNPNKKVDKVAIMRIPNDTKLNLGSANNINELDMKRNRDLSFTLKLISLKTKTIKIKKIQN